MIEDCLSFLAVIERCEGQSQAAYAGIVCERTGFTTNRCLEIEKHCLSNGYVTQNRRGNYALTDEGRAYLAQHEGAVTEPEGLGDVFMTAGKPKLGKASAAFYGWMTGSTLLLKTLHDCQGSLAKLHHDSPLAEFEQLLRKLSVAVLALPIANTPLNLSQGKGGDSAALGTGDVYDDEVCGTSATVRFALHALLFLLIQFLKTHGVDADLTTQLCHLKTSIQMGFKPSEVDEKMIQDVVSLLTSRKEGSSNDCE